MAWKNTTCWPLPQSSWFSESGWDLSILHKFQSNADAAATRREMLKTTLWEPLIWANEIKAVCNFNIHFHFSLIVSCQSFCFVVKITVFFMCVHACLRVYVCVCTCTPVSFQNKLENEQFTLGFLYSHFPMSSPFLFELFYIFFTIISVYLCVCLLNYFTALLWKAVDLIRCYILSQFFWC